MKENFLHYLWQYQLFNKQELVTRTGESIYVQKTGYHNQNSGPDFKEATIQVGDQLWAGSVEIHLKSSDWYVHNHETDTAYDNVILHVVWEDDISIFRKNNTPISCLELKGLVPKHLYNNYQELFQNKKVWIACENSIKQVDQFIWSNWMERLYVERLADKSVFITDLLRTTVNDWEAVLFQLLLKNFGLKVNGDAFATLGMNLNFSVVRKEKTKTINLEALLMGQAGLLDDKLADSYYQELQEIYSYQQHKYKLSQTHSRIQFFRLRPPNFPTIRLSQFVSLFSEQDNLFQKLMSTSDVDTCYKILQTRTSTYWNTHYVFGKESKKSTKRLTKSFIDLVLINTIIPLQFAYQKYIGKQDPEVFLNMIQQIKPEKNAIVEKYRGLGLEVTNALHSQALLNLKNTYCKSQRCLECAVGLQILKKE